MVLKDREASAPATSKKATTTASATKATSAGEDSIIPPYCSQCQSYESSCIKTVATSEEVPAVAPVPEEAPAEAPEEAPVLQVLAETAVARSKILKSTSLYPCQNWLCFQLSKNRQGQHHQSLQHHQQQHHHQVKLLVSRELVEKPEKQPELNPEHTGKQLQKKKKRISWPNKTLRLFFFY